MTMRSVVVLVVAACLAACAQNPVAQQAAADTRFDPMRADTMVAVNFAPGASAPDANQVNELRTMVAAGRRAERDEFVVVSDGSGGPVQRLRAERVSAVGVRLLTLRSGSSWARRSKTTSRPSSASRSGPRPPET